MEAQATSDGPCTKNLLDGYWDNGRTHLHELPVSRTFTSAGRRGKLLAKSRSSCTVAWARKARRYNVGTGRYRTDDGWGAPQLVTRCLEVEPC